MIENQAADSVEQGAPALGVKSPIPELQGKADGGRIDSSSQPTSHISHVYHIGSLESINQVHHIYSSSEDSNRAKSGSLKGQASSLSLMDVSPTLETMDARVQNLTVFEPKNLIKLDRHPIRVEPTAPKDVNQVWLSSQGEWQWSNAQVITGHFQGSSKSEIAFFYDYGEAGGYRQALWLFAGKYNFQPTRVFDSGSAWAKPEGVITGDFKGSGKTDVAAFFGYGKDAVGLVLFSSDSQFQPDFSWRSGFGNWDWSKVLNVIPGDFKGSGKTDIAIFYDYGSSQTGLWIFDSNSNFQPSRVWMNGWSHSTAIAGDFRGSGKTEIAVFYDYGDQTALYFFGSDSNFQPIMVWDSGFRNWNWSSTKAIAGNFKETGKTDIAAFFGYGGSQTRLWLFTSDKNFEPYVVWDSGLGNFDWSKIVEMVTGDFSNSGTTDLAVFYNYGNSQIGLWIFSSDTNFQPTQVWISGSGELDWSRVVKVMSGDFQGNGTIDIALLYEYPNKETGLWILPTGNKKDNNPPVLANPVAPVPVASNPPVVATPVAHLPVASTPPVVATPVVSPVPVASTPPVVATPVAPPAPVASNPTVVATPVAPVPVASNPPAVDQLNAQLPVVNNSLSLSTGNLPIIGDLLQAFNNGNPMEIVNVGKSISANGISLTGSTSFMGENNVGISASIEPSGDYTFKVDFPSSSLRNFLSLSSLDLPSDFDVSLPETWAIISSKDKILNIVAAATGSLGEISIQGTREETGWQFTAGIDLAASNFASFSALKPLAAFDDFVGLTDIVMILSSRAAPEFDFPDTDQFGVPALSWGKIKLPDDAGGLVEGLNFYATLSTAKSEPFRLLANFLGVKLDGSVTIELSVSLPDPELSSKLFISFNEDDIFNGLSMYGTVGGVLQDGQVGAELTATANTSIQHQPVQFDVTAVAVETGAFITGNMISTGNPIGFTIEGIHFSIADLGLLIGIDDAGVPSLGFAATIDIGHVQASAALFFDSVQPAQSMFAASVSSLTLFDVASTIAGQNDIPVALENVLKNIGLKPLTGFTVQPQDAQPLITALDNRDLTTVANLFSQYGGDDFVINTSDQLLLDVNIKSSLWYLTDLSQQIMHYELNARSDGAVTVSREPQFYCCPQQTQIGSVTYNPGFSIMAYIDYYFIGAQVQVQAQGSTGISAEVTLDKIIIGHEDFLIITDATGDTGPQFTMSTFAQGAQEPHISISGAMTILGLSLPSVFLDISESGVDFKMSYPMSEPYFTLQGTIGDPNNMDLDAEIDVSVNETLDLGALGKIPFDAGVKGDISLSVKKGRPNASVEGTFDFDGSTFKTGDITPESLDPKRLAKTFVPYIQKVIEKDLKSDATKWTNMVKDGAIQGIKGADQMAGVLNSEFNLNASDASRLLSKAGCTVDDISNALKGAYKLSNEVTLDTLQKSLNLGESDINDLAHKLGIPSKVTAPVDHAINKIGREFKHIFRAENDFVSPVSEPKVVPHADVPTIPAIVAKPSARPLIKPPTARLTNPLLVPYCNQLGLAEGHRYWREGFSASSAMLAMYWGKEPNENVYDKLRNRYGDSNTAEAQLNALRSLGLTADFHTDGTTMLLKQEIDAGRPVAVAWLCDGPVSAPSGGGHWSVIIGYDDTGFFMNDPYGTCDLVDGGYLSNNDGARLHYSYENWVPRWRVDGTGGWMLTSRVRFG